MEYKIEYISPMAQTLDLIPAGLVCSSPLGNEDIGSGDMIEWTV